VRELENALERAVTLTQGSLVELGALPAKIQDLPPLPEKLVLAMGITLKEAEQEILAQTLRRTRGDKKATAHLLGISLANLYLKLKNLPRDDSKK
jgi:DNA-binding NtrC family response regulator